MATTQPRPASQKLPAGLAGVLNPSDDNRDSAYYSSTDASSKRAFNPPPCLGNLQRFSCPAHPS